MKKLILVFCVFGSAAAASAQQKAMDKAEQVVSLRPENWVARPGAVEFGDSAGVARMKIVSRQGNVILKGGDFGDGTIEFDIIPTDPTFTLFCFRWRDSLETECFYFRTQLGVRPYAMAAVQYTPIVRGTMLWDMLPQYQTYAAFDQKTASHVKLVISGRQMRVYVNPAGAGAAAVSRSSGASAGTAMPRPVLEVPELEGNTTHGTLVFKGQAIISNFVLKPGKVEGLSPVAGPDPVAYDPRYLRHWMMTRPDSLPAGVDFSYGLVPGKETEWEAIDAERMGVINLTRRWQVVPTRHQIIWLKTTIHADEARSCQLRLGFLDEVWMYLNDRLLYVDKNLYPQLLSKVPNGRMSLDNTTVVLPLKQGDNVLRIAVGSNFYSWGIMARLDDLEGLKIERTADGR